MQHTSASNPDVNYIIPMKKLNVGLRKSFAWFVQYYIMRKPYLRSLSIYICIMILQMSLEYIVSKKGGNKIGPSVVKTIDAKITCIQNTVNAE